MLNGRPLPWDLQRDVALIEKEIWKAGPEKVGERIAEIERERSEGTNGIIPEKVSPNTVDALFARAPVVQAGMVSMSEAITLRVDAFTAMARPNERIAFVETLRSMPDTAQRIYDILETGPEARDAQTVLALEVGRLRAQVEQLKADLRAAHSELEELRDKPWYRRSWILFAGSVFPAIGVGLWTLSDPDFDGADRWNNVAEELGFLRSKIAPSAGEQSDEPLRFELPDIEDT